MTDNSIIVRIMGGLGNQIFQYCGALATARRLGVPLKIDTSFFTFNPKFTYSLNCFEGIAHSNLTFSTFQEVKKRSGVFLKHTPSLSLYYRLFNHFHYSYPTLKPLLCAGENVFCEKQYHYDPEFEQIRAGALLVGYFQSEKYFESVIPEIRKTFKISPHSLSGANLELFEKIKSSPSVAIHIRRGDYVSDAATHQTHGVCELDYFYKAIQQIEEKRNHPLELFIFSDDQDWVKANWKKQKHPTHFVTGNYSGSFDGNKDSIDLMLMSACKDQIISNSSFSWWAAWLNETADKTVIAPGRWFKSSLHNDSTVIPKGWHRI